MDRSRPGAGMTVATLGLVSGDDATAIQDTFDLMPGMMVGEYRVESQIGAGGMGRVYAAIHPLIAKRAAIKVLHPELSVNRESVERFIQEARSVNQIGHPNIVDIFAFGTLPDGRNYFVMEWLRGESLRQRIHRDVLPLHDALAILDTTTLALAAAHENGIVHRDLKPDNVFLVDVKGYRPQVKLLDFGIAKLIGPQGLNRTQTGNMLGTPAYMSPEQARAQSVDHRTDIYALGAMMFELLTGQLAFDVNNSADMIAKHLSEPPRSAAALNPDVPAQLDALIIRMMAKDAGDRPTLDVIREEIRARQGQIPIGAVSRRFSVPRFSPGTPAPSPYTPPPSLYAPANPPASAAPTVFPTPARRSPVSIIVISTLAAIGIAIGAWFAITSSDSGSTVKPPLSVVPDGSAAIAKPVVIETVKPTVPVTPEPAEPTKPADSAKPDVAVTTTSEAVRTTKPTHKKKRTGTSTPTNHKPGTSNVGSGSGASDDDAPM